MVRLKVHELMARRGISAYALSRPGGRFGRLHADTLDRLCLFFKVQPGQLLTWVPPPRR